MLRSCSSSTILQSWNIVPSCRHFKRRRKLHKSPVSHARSFMRCFKRWCQYTGFHHHPIILLFQQIVFPELACWMSSRSLLSNFLRNLPSPIIIQSTVTFRDSQCSNYVTHHWSVWRVTSLPIWHFGQFLVLRSLTHLRSLDLKSGRATSDLKKQIKNVHLFSSGSLSVLSLELCTACIER